MNSPKLYLSRLIRLLLGLTTLCLLDLGLAPLSFCLNARPAGAVVLSEPAKLAALKKNALSYPENASLRMAYATALFDGSLNKARSGLLHEARTLAVDSEREFSAAIKLFKRSSRPSLTSDGYAMIGLLRLFVFSDPVSADYYFQRSRRSERNNELALAGLRYTQSMPKPKRSWVQLIAFWWRDLMNMLENVECSLWPSADFSNDTAADGKNIRESDQAVRPFSSKANAAILLKNGKTFSCQIKQKTPYGLWAAVNGATIFLRSDEIDYVRPKENSDLSPSSAAVTKRS